jgi:hypothetical protein
MPATAVGTRAISAHADSTVFDVRRGYQGRRPAKRSRADVTPAASLIDWAVGDGFALDLAVPAHRWN